jgi:hypothetical protein
MAQSPDAADISSLARNYARYAQEIGGATNELYAIWSPASVAFSVDYGQETLSQAEAWRNLMIASPDWRVVYARQGTYLFRVVVTADEPVASAARHEHEPHGQRPRRGHQLGRGRPDLPITVPRRERLKRLTARSGGAS